MHSSDRSSPRRRRSAPQDPPVRPDPRTRHHTARRVLTEWVASSAAPANSSAVRPPEPVVPLIVAGYDELAAADAGIVALGSCPDLFVHGDRLVHLVPVPRAPTPLGLPPPGWRIEALPAARLRELLSRHARWAVPASDDLADLRPTSVPSWAVRAIAGRRQWPGLRVLMGLVTTPVLRPDGSVLEAPGYDAATGLFYAPDGAYPRVPLSPTLADAKQAIDRLLALVDDVPFATEADRAGWLSMVVTPLVRYAMAGPPPLHVLSASRSLVETGPLLDLTASVLCGTAMASVDASDLLSPRRRSAESLLAQGEPVALLTDVEGPGAPGLGRVLRELQRDRGAHRLLWFVAGVALARGRDLGASCLPITLAAPDTAALRPARPVGAFPIHDVGERRGELIVAALTVLRAWWAAGRPEVALPPWPGYGAWSRSVRAALVWAGQPDPRDGADGTASGQEPTRDPVADLIGGWAEVAASFPGGCSVRQALDALLAAPPSQYGRLRSAVATLSPGPLEDRATADRLGRTLSRFRSVESGGLHLHLASSGNQGNRWAVRATRG